MYADKSMTKGETGEVRSRWPRYEEDEIAAVTDVLRSGRVNALVHGDRCRAFEAAFADFCGVPHAIALANGTLALELALRALGIGPGDEVIVPARSFFASASCVVAVGATPVFADVDPVSQAIAPDSVRAMLTPHTRAVLCVHLAGWPCEMDALMEICERHSLFLIEDCAQAHGALYRGRMAGSFGDAAAFSFCTDKIMSTGGEGGMLLLRNQAVWERAWSWKDHGKNPHKLINPPPGNSFRWIHDGFGSNYRMTEMQAAIGLVQLEKLSGWLARRRRNASLLDTLLSGEAMVRLAVPPDHIGHARYKYYAFIEPHHLPPGRNRDDMIAEMATLGLPCASGSCPEIYREDAFSNSPARPAQPMPTAKALGESSLMLPVDHTLGDEDMRRLGGALRSIFSNWSQQVRAA
ncbi:MAG: DegT/DnrJ/EryC1/StrS aminotransferase family protein [Alphaproteobacteria bacterium]|nr:DegT/DnrJ/EryC1/StrS aminotransferase family protein [Alphaproteobacteria bacterium]